MRSSLALFALALLSSVAAKGPGSDGSGGDGSTDDDVTIPPYYLNMTIAHAIMCTVGFLGVLPAGALLARYLRTFSNRWFTGHWIFQLAIALPITTTGVGLGCKAVHKSSNIARDTHVRLGIAIFILYMAQLFLGAFIHYIKPASWTVGKRRPIQNYFHAVFGLIIIGLSYYQVRLGINTEWQFRTGQPPIPKAANIVWYFWVVFIPILYILGLAFLPRQYRQERAGAKSATSSETESVQKA